MKNSKKNPLVSVIIPAYNRADTLSTCLDSIFLQDYPNIEIIVIDDGSTDDTEKVLSHKKIKIWFLSRHKGQCSARNMGLDLARGKYILLLDSDDGLFPDVIKRHVEFLESHPKIDLVYGDMIMPDNYVFDDPYIRGIPVRLGTPIDYDMKKALLKNLQYPLDPKHSILHLYTPDLRFFCISTGTALFRKNEVRYDIVIEQNWNCSADVDFWGQLIMSGVIFHYLPGIALRCRTHIKNITNTTKEETRYGVRKYIYNKLKKQVEDEIQK